MKIKMCENYVVKRSFSLFVVMVLCFTVFITTEFSYASETQNKDIVVSVDGDGVKHYTKTLSEEEYDDILNAMIDDVVSKEITSSTNNGIAICSTSKPKYVAVYGAQKTTKAPYKRMAGQPEGGFHFTGGGTVNINNTGGTTFSFSYSFPTPYGSIGISAKPGKKATKVTGYSANIPASSKYSYLVYVSNTYKSKPYIIYEDSTKKDIVRKGAVSTLYSTSVDVRRAK